LTVKIFKSIAVGNLLLSLTLFILTFFGLLFAHVFSWVWLQVCAPENVFHVIVFLSLSWFVCSALYFNRRKLLPQWYVFQWNYFSFFVCLFWCCGFLLNEYFTVIYVFSSIFMVIAGYGLLGFYVSLNFLRQAIIPCALIVLILPFEGYLDISLGFPLRLFRVDMAGNLLSII